MEFFFETGVFLLIVALAAAVAGFVALRVLGLGRLFRRSTSRPRSGGQRQSSGDDGLDGWDAPFTAPDATHTTAAAPGNAVTPVTSKVPTREVSEPAAHDAPVTSAAPVALSTPATESQVERAAPPSAADSPGAAPSDGAVEPPATLASEEGNGEEQQDVPVAEQGVHEAGEAQDEALSEGPEKTVSAPPDESSDAAVAHGVLAMFTGGEDDDSTVGELADKLEDVDMGELLAHVKDIAAELCSKGGHDA